MIIYNETFIKCCGECGINFVNGQMIYYTWYENRCFCDNCKNIINDRVSERYLDWQIRKVNRGE